MQASLGEGGPRPGSTLALVHLVRNSPMNTGATPTATVIVEPTGPRRAVPRDHAIHVRLSLVGVDGRHSDRDHVADLARQALAALQLGAGEAHRPYVTELSGAVRATLAGAIPIRLVVGVEGTSVCKGRPTAEAMVRLHGVLVDQGYRVAVREKRECEARGCTACSTMNWGLGSDVPASWHTSAVCGAHDHRTCERCGSTHASSSVNAAGQAPSVHCEVCGRPRAGAPSARDSV